MIMNRKVDEINHSKGRRANLDKNFNYLDEETKNDIVSYNVYENRNFDKKVINNKVFHHYYSNLKFYSLTESSVNYKINWLKKKCKKNLKVLDFACGNGENAFLAAKYDCIVDGIDISPDGINFANKKKNEILEGKNCNFQVMDGENLAFQENSFDLAIEYGALHHVDLDRTLSELARVLKKNGEMLCIETLKHNPIINWYRKKTPQMRTAYEVKHILGIENITDFKKYFYNVEIKFFHLTSIIALPFRKTFFFRPLLKIFNLLDSLILKNSLIGKFAWIMIVELKNPKKN